ncbi:nitroreductase family protein [Planococcus sp. N028]|uniref:Nitroreductase family protein n=1 Tax=Planococcus shixiaomingii TaxID=3058393 RepID=A0ABT8N3E4_9BACL|nr:MULTISPECIES: nitroreductase family protein [unclassified Planococcus (in: firmicutes)]MDN7242413.1 nitroreductase family protein [Planococcus sp. N028]WKA54654.1 nitroreductase family protein [Planococcus sp. N022]
MSVKTESSLYKVMTERKSVRVYDPNFKISKEEIEEMLKLATTAPSSSNLQSWNFIVIQDQEVKKELRAIANNQAQVEQSSAIIAVLGNVDAYKNVEKIYTQNVEAGYMDEAIKERTIANTYAMYPNAPVEARMNIAAYDAGLVSMQLMLIAKERGYDTIPMGGFDKAKFAERFDLPEHLFPIVLIAVGKAAAPAFGTTRLPLEEVTRFI